MDNNAMTRSSIALCAALLFAACTSDGGPGTESPVLGGIGGMNAGGQGGSAGTSGAGGNAGAAGNNAGAGGSAGAGVGGTGAGAGGQSGEAGAGSGGMGGGEPGNDDDAGTDDGEGFCTVACTGIPPDEGISEACAAIETMAECAMFETGGFPSSCRWMTPDSEPCLAP